MAKRHWDTQAYIKLGCILSLVFCAIHIVYLLAACENSVFMDNWRYFALFGDLYADKDITLSYIFHAEYGQRYPLLMLLLYLNVQWLHFNSMAGILLGGVVNGVISTVLIWFYVRYSCNETQNERTLPAFWGVIFILLSYWNYNRWEISILQCSNSFMLRILISLLAMMLTDRILHAKSRVHFRRNLGLLLFLLALSALFMGHLYFVALMISVLISFGLMVFCTNKPEEKRIWIIGFCFCAVVSALCTMIYMRGIDPASMPVAANPLSLTTFVLGMLYVLVAIVVPNGYLQGMPTSAVILVGCLMAALIVFCAIQFFLRKLYQKSLLPLMLALYGFFSAGMVLIGRAGYGAEYCGSSRYVCETQFLVVACVMIGVSLFRSRQLSKGLHFVGIFVCLCCSCLMLFSFFVEMQIAPYRKEYQENLNQMVLANPNGLAEGDDWAITQANSLELVNRAIPILRKNHWGMFYGQPDNLNLIGIYSDGWLAKESAFQIRSGEDGLLHVELYQPKEEYQTMSGVITVNGDAQEFALTGETTVLDIPVEPDALLDVSIVMERDFPVDGDDIRQLSVFLSDLSCS